MKQQLDDAAMQRLDRAAAGARAKGRMGYQSSRRAFCEQDEADLRLVQRARARGDQVSAAEGADGQPPSHAAIATPSPMA